MNYTVCGIASGHLFMPMLLSKYLKDKTIGNYSPPNQSPSRALRAIGHLLALQIIDERCVVSFQCDSRLTKPGDLFFALPGAKVDGHDFLQEVAAKGGIAAVVSQKYQGEDFGLTLLKVPDVLRAMQWLAHQRYLSSRAQVIAVSGSLGKTTTKEFIATILEKRFRVIKTPGTANSQIGVPLTILNAEKDPELFVLEMGMTQKGEMRTLVEIAPPFIGVITPIALVHVASFPNGIEGIAAEKSEIFGTAYTKLGIVHESALHFQSIVARTCPLWAYGSKRECPFHFEQVSEGERWRIVERGMATPSFSMSELPAYYVHNFVGAVAVARALELSWEEIFARLSYLRTIPRRFERVKRNGVLFINDAYNANSVSVRAALSHLPKPKNQGKTIAVLGSMQELGKYSKACHEEVAEVAFYTIDVLLCFGEECASMVALFVQRKKPVEIFFDISLLRNRVFALAEPGDVVLIKGANVQKLWEILE